MISSWIKHSRFRQVLHRFQVAFDEYRDEDAKKQLSALIALKPDHEDTIFSRALVDQRNGDNEGARCLFEQLSRSKPNNQVFHLAVAESLLALGQYELAELSLEKALKLDRHNVRTLYDLGLLYIRTGMIERAQEYFSRVCILDRDFYQSRMLVLQEQVAWKKT